MLAPHGWQEIGENIAKAFRSGDFAGMSAAVPDEMVDAIALTGTPDEVRDKIAEWKEVADHLLFYSPSVGMKRERLMENMESIVDTFGTEGARHG